MKTLIIIIVAMALVAATVAGTVYLHDLAKVKLAQIHLESKRIDAALDSQRLIAKAYHDSFSMLRRVAIVGLIAFAMCVFFAWKMFEKMTDSVTDMAMISGGYDSFRIECDVPERIEYQYQDDRYCGAMPDRGCP